MMVLSSIQLMLVKSKSRFIKEILHALMLDNDQIQEVKTLFSDTEFEYRIV